MLGTLVAARRSRKDGSEKCGGGSWWAISKGNCEIDIVSKWVLIRAACNGFRRGQQYCFSQLERGVPLEVQEMADGALEALEELAVGDVR